MRRTARYFYSFERRLCIRTIDDADVKRSFVSSPFSRGRDEKYLVVVLAVVMFSFPR